MARRAVDALEVPDGFAGLGEMVCQEPSPILPVKDACETPLIAHQGAQVTDFHHQ